VPFVPPGSAGERGDSSAGLSSFPAAGELRITELLINPAGTDTGREWVEIQNVSARVLDLSRVHLADRLNDASVEWGGEDPTLPSGACAVLLQSVDPTKNGGIDGRIPAAGGGGGTGPGSGTAGGSSFLRGSFGTRVSLNNDADTISLCVDACASGLLVDRFEWDAAPGADYDGHALSRDGRGRFCPSPQPFGDAGSFGTPGTTNPACP